MSTAPPASPEEASSSIGADAAPDSKDSGSEAPGRRSFQRHVLGERALAAEIFDGVKPDPVQGKVTNASVNSLWIEGGEPFPLKTLLTVELAVPGGERASFPARVVRSTGTGMALQLSVDDGSWQLRASFIEAAIGTAEPRPTVAVHKGGRAAPGESAAAKSARIAELGRVWKEVRAAVDDDALHQRFIHECLRDKTLEFALERYRDLKAERPDDERITKYITQIGTILSFYTLQKSSAKEKSPLARKLGVIILLLALVMGVLFGARSIIRQHLALDEKEAPQPPGNTRTPE